VKGLVISSLEEVHVATRVSLTHAAGRENPIDGINIAESLFFSSAEDWRDRPGKLFPCRSILAVGEP
jgi:hypothetical protein